MSAEGRLLVCATPIGNLGDVTLRVLDALREADAVAAEDTRVTRKLLSRYDIHTPLERYDDNTAAERTPRLVARVAAGETIALVSDAGTPGISDPGAALIRACLDSGLDVEVLPGASAIIAALVASGLPTHAFYFGGFLPRKSAQRKRLLEGLASLDATLLFYESARRVVATLEDVAETLPGRFVAVARELTKMHEEVVRGPVAEVAKAFSEREVKGEVVLAIGPSLAGEVTEPDVEAIAERIDALVVGGSSMKDAVRQVASDTGLPRNLVYDIAHERRTDRPSR
ncbi:MAG: 16S rRNA (cytidine(1402)-2'-O)-methyltransferase [Coriobacteriia bacterium]|nr:16S rRNA (cytidine(1402)-2'-O)-methyltransferase [Coriobacteriia bacterium]